MTVIELILQCQRVVMRLRPRYAPNYLKFVFVRRTSMRLRSITNMLFRVVMRLLPKYKFLLGINILADYASDCSYSSDYSYVRSAVSIPPEPVVEAPLEPEVEVVQPDVEAEHINETPSLGTDILEALGEPKNKAEVYAPKIRDEISERWGKIVVDGLSKESIQKLIENIHIPENFKLLKAPGLNPEISAVLSESTKNRDKRLEKAQNHLGLGIAAVTNLMTSLINGDMDKTDIIKKLSEAGQLLLDLHCQNTSARKKLIMFSLDKKFSTIVQGVKRDSLLFGENLGEKIKANKTAETSGLQIKRTFEPQPSTSSYRPNQPASRQGNWKGPPRSQAQRGKRGAARTQASPQVSRRIPATVDRYTNSTRTTNQRDKPARRT